MWAYLIDEDMPRPLASVLRAAGFDAVDVRDIGMAGSKDPEVFARAQSMDAVLITADREFANLLKFPLGSHAGIIITRTPNDISVLHLNNLVLYALERLAGRDLHGALVVIEVGRTRVRWPDSRNDDLTQE